MTYLNISLYSLQQTTWHLSTKYQNGKIAEEVRLSTVLLSYVKRKSWDRLFRSGGSHFIYCSQLWASSLPENLCCCLDLDLLQHNRRILRFFSNSIFCLWGHLQTMWIVFWVFLTPSLPHVDHRGFLITPPCKPCGFFSTPPLSFKKN